MTLKPKASTHGGRRAGAGRKPAPTKTVRVPEGTEAVARGLAELARSHATTALVASQWYRSLPAELRQLDPTVTLAGIEHQPVHSSMGARPTGAQDEPFLVFHAELGRYKAIFRMRMDFGKDSPVLMVNEQGTR